MDTDLKKKLADAIWAGRSLFERGKTSGSSANMSFLHDGKMYISQSGSCFGTLTEEQFAVMTMDGTCVSDNKPSKEWPLHLQIYQKKPGCGAVIHTHGTYSVLWSFVPAKDETAWGCRSGQGYDGRLLLFGGVGGERADCLGAEKFRVDGLIFCNHFQLHFRYATKNDCKTNPADKISSYLSAGFYSIFISLLSYPTQSPVPSSHPQPSQIRLYLRLPHNCRPRHNASLRHRPWRRYPP